MCVNHPDSHTDSSFKSVLLAECVCAQVTHSSLCVRGGISESDPGGLGVFWKMTCLNHTLKDSEELAHFCQLAEPFQPPEAESLLTMVE